MLAERLAVIANDGNDRVRAIDRREQSADLRVDVGNLAVVRLRVRRRRRVRRVRVVQMHPCEERLPAALLQPGKRAIDGGVAAPLCLEHVCFVRRVARNLVVVQIEAATQPESMIEHERADERAGAISAAIQNRRKVIAIRRKRVRPVVANAVMQWQHSREQRAVRGKRERNGRVGVGKADGVFCELLQIGRAGAEAVGAEGVEGD